MREAPIRAIFRKTSGGMAGGRRLKNDCDSHLPFWLYQARLLKQAPVGPHPNVVEWWWYERPFSWRIPGSGLSWSTMTERVATVRHWLQSRTRTRGLTLQLYRLTRKKTDKKRVGRMCWGCLMLSCVCDFIHVHTDVERVERRWRGWLW